MVMKEGKRKSRLKKLFCCSFVALVKSADSSARTRAETTCVSLPPAFGGKLEPTAMKHKAQKLKISGGFTDTETVY